MDYERAPDGSLHWVRPVLDDGTAILFRAKDIRRERQSIHALISVYRRIVRLEAGERKVEHSLLDEDDIALRRREERNRLANAAHKALGTTPYPQGTMQHDLLLFCRGLWDAHIGAQEAVRSAGATERTMPHFLLQPFIIAEAGTILFAPPGRGKSWTGLLMAVSVDAGVPYFWQATPGPVLYVNLERSRTSMERRLGDVNAVLDQPRDRELLMLHARGQSLMDVLEPMQRTVEKEGCVLVVVDSLSRMGVGDLTENQPANRAMDMLNSLPCSWLALAHTPRGDESHIYGSQMFDAAADLAVGLLTEEQPTKLGIAMKVAKANDIAKPAPVQFAYEFDAMGLKRVRTAEDGEFLTLTEAVSPRSLKDRVDDYLKEMGPASATDIAIATDVHRPNVVAILRRDEYEDAGRDGRKKLYRLKTAGSVDVSHALAVHSTHEQPTQSLLREAMENPEA